MEVLSIAVNFHDIDVKWKTKVKDGRFSLTIGSEKDRIQIIFTPDELAQFFAQYAETQEWIIPNGS